MPNQETDTNQNQQSTQEKLLHNSGTRTFYVIEKGGMYFKGYDLESNRVEFTSNIMEARWFTHTRAAKPRAGERIQQIVIDIAHNSISVLS